MKGIMHTMKTCSVIMAVLFAFTMLFGMTSRVWAEEGAGEPYEDGRKGSITVTLKEEEGMNREGVQMNLYKVGNVDVSHGYLDFSPVDELEGIDADLNDIISSEANAAIAGILAEAVEERNLEMTGSLWTDAGGQVTFEDLDQGMYLVLQGNANAYGTILPSVVPVPYADETSWEYDVEIEPKATPVTTLGRIDVTKMVKGINPDGNLQDVHTTDATYYIGLFMDAEGEHLYGETGNNVKPVHIIDGSSGTVSFDNIPITDQPYYIFETTEDGRPIKYLEQQGTENGFYCMAGEVIGAEGHDAPPVIIMENEADAIGTAVISNVYSDGLPEGYYYTGEITITKSIMDNDQMVASGDTFYAGIFAVDAQGNMSANPTEVVKLNNNGSVTVEVPLGGANGTEAITYAVKETNENGVPVSQDSAFLYTVTGEGNVTLSTGENTGTIHITNSLGDSDGYYQEEPSTQAPASSGNNNSGNNGSSGTSGGTNRSSRSGKTGDNNQILLYAGLLAAAVIVGGVVVVRRRRR